MTLFSESRLLHFAAETPEGGETERALPEELQKIYDSTRKILEANPANNADPITQKLRQQQVRVILEWGDANAPVVERLLTDGVLRPRDVLNVAQSQRPPAGNARLYSSASRLLLIIEGTPLPGVPAADIDGLYREILNFSRTSALPAANDDAGWETLIGAVATLPKMGEAFPLNARLGAKELQEHPQYQAVVRIFEMASLANPGTNDAERKAYQPRIDAMRRAGAFAFAEINITWTEQRNGNQRFHQDAVNAMNVLYNRAPAEVQKAIQAAEQQLRKDRQAPDTPRDIS